MVSLTLLVFFSDFQICDMTISDNNGTQGEPHKASSTHSPRCGYCVGRLCQGLGTALDPFGCIITGKKPYRTYIQLGPRCFVWERLAFGGLARENPTVRLPPTLLLPGLSYLRGHKELMLSYSYS